jgi:hypothetical protein
MAPATTHEVEELLGDVDMFTIERILDTRATTDEIAEALADVEDEHRFGDRRAPTTPRVAEVRAILEELVWDDQDAYAS